VNLGLNKNSLRKNILFGDFFKLVNEIRS
jgi:hypothetical protein